MVSSKYWSAKAASVSVRSSCLRMMCRPSFSSAGSTERFRVEYCCSTMAWVRREMARSCSSGVMPAMSFFV